MDLLSRYPAYVYQDAAKLYLNHVFTGKDCYVNGNRGGTTGPQMCNAIVEYAIYNRFPDWTAEDAIEKMTPQLFFDLGLSPLLRGNDARQKLFVPPFLLIDGKTAFPDDPVRSKARFAPINMNYVMRWVFGMDPDWKEVVRFYYRYLQGCREASSRPGTARCSRYIYSNWRYDGAEYLIHDNRENAMIFMDCFLDDLERDHVLTLGSPSEDLAKYQRRIYTFFALNGHKELTNRGLGSYVNLYDGRDALTYIHQYLCTKDLFFSQKALGDFLICEQIRLDAASGALRRLAAKPGFC